VFVAARPLALPSAPCTPITRVAWPGACSNARRVCLCPVCAALLVGRCCCSAGSRLPWYRLTGVCVCVCVCVCALALQRAAAVGRVSVAACVRAQVASCPPPQAGQPDARISMQVCDNRRSGSSSSRWRVCSIPWCRLLVWSPHRALCWRRSNGPCCIQQGWRAVGAGMAHSAAAGCVCRTCCLL
jgi:hypothetical protein